MKNLTLIVAIAFTFACSAPTKKESASDQPSMKEQVMAVHDEVMPKMGDLMKARKALLAKLETTTDSTEVAKLKQLAAEIEAANEGMMVWMRNFDPNFSGTEAETEAYLNDQLKSVEKVKSDMLNALAAGQMVLEQQVP